MRVSLVEKLRRYIRQYETPPIGGEVDGVVIELLIRAANRIEQLEDRHYTGLDDSAHKVFDFAEHVHGFTKTESKCPRCGNKLRAFYYEARLYGVRCDYCPAVTLLEERNPYEAAKRVAEYAHTRQADSPAS